jgi:hypothetical protein
MVIFKRPGTSKMGHYEDAAGLRGTIFRVLTEIIHCNGCRERAAESLDRFVEKCPIEVQPGRLKTGKVGGVMIPCLEA